MIYPVVLFLLFFDQISTNPKQTLIEVIKYFFFLFFFFKLTGKRGRSTLKYSKNRSQNTLFLCGNDPWGPMSPHSCLLLCICKYVYDFGRNTCKQSVSLLEKAQEGIVKGEVVLRRWKPRILQLKVSGCLPERYTDDWHWIRHCSCYWVLVQDCE